MGTLNFPCPSCGSMVSTVGLAPGAAPACSGCGRAFPASMAASSVVSGGGRRGSPIAFIGLLVPLVIVGAVFFLFAAKRRGAAMGSLEEARVSMAREHSAQATARRAELIARLENDDWNTVIGAWHELAACDAQDHEGTFRDLKAAYRRSKKTNCLHLLTGGMCEYYGEPGEKAVTEELLKRAAEATNLQTVCDALEAMPVEMSNRGGGDAAKIQYALKSLRILEAARDQLPSGDASRRVLATIRHLRPMLPAEK